MMAEEDAYLQVEEKYQKIFGTDSTTMEEMYNVSWCDELEEFVCHAYCGSYERLAMSMLSDAQEMMDRGHNDAARILINRAKYVLEQGHSARGASNNGEGTSFE